MSFRTSLLVLATLWLAGIHAAHAGPTVDLRNGAVYLMTNQYTNGVVAYYRGPNGALTRVGRFATGGHGNPTPQGTDPAVNPLASQGSLVLSQDRRFLFAANAGSNEISVFRIYDDALALIDIKASGGSRPISLAVTDGLLYVLNEGGTPNITGFTIGEFGQLQAIANSTRGLPSGRLADPAQLSFSPDGRWLVVTEKLSNLIGVYSMFPDGRPSAPSVTPSEGLTPCGFDFAGIARLVVSEARNGTAAKAAASSYAVVAGNVLDTISRSVRDYQTGACWVAVTRDRRYAYVSNPGSGEVSSYRIGLEGQLSLFDSTASETDALSYPLDLALSHDDQFLLVHMAGKRSIAVFRVGLDGRLVRVASATDVPYGAQGIAAF
jgi:6-phosphogluconolactonase (cycloisomerase 2 family)